MTKDKNVLCKEPVYAWSKNIVEVLLLNEIEIAHWCVLMKKLHWTPPSLFSLFDILLFTAFTAKQYYCHPNEFPVYTFKIDHDRPGFVMMHSRWAKQNSITLRAWEVNKKFNKLKVPLENYSQASFGAEKLQLPCAQAQTQEKENEQAFELEEREGDIVVVQQKSNESDKQKKMEEDIDEIVRQLKEQHQQQKQQERHEAQLAEKEAAEEKLKALEEKRKSEKEERKLEERKEEIVPQRREECYQQDFQQFKFNHSELDELSLQQQMSYQELPESELNDDSFSVQHFLQRDQSYR